MILSAMMFALGIFLSGLLWLGLSVALVRRAQRLTERRVLAGIATRRAEFEAERDELRARHAVEMHRLGSEVSRVLDMATAHRLEADVKDNDLVSLRAEYAAREEDLNDMQQRLADERDLVQDLERRHAEAGSALRAVQHSLAQETKRRAAAEDALDEAMLLAEDFRLELSALRAENAALRATVDDRIAESESAALPTPAILQRRQESTVTEVAPAPAASVVPLHARPRAPAAGPAELPSAPAAEPGRNVQRLAGEGHGDLARGVWRAPAHTEPRMPAASSLAAEPGLAKREPSGNGAAAPTARAEAAEAKDNPETRFFEALAEIRALKRAASQAGE
jgi:hypothetical protein